MPHRVAALVERDGDAGIIVDERFVVRLVRRGFDLGNAVRENVHLLGLGERHFARRARRDGILMIPSDLALAAVMSRALVLADRLIVERVGFVAYELNLD